MIYFYLQTPDWKDIPNLLQEFDKNFIESELSAYDYEDFEEILPMSIFDNEINGFIDDFIKDYQRVWNQSDHRTATNVVVLTNKAKMSNIEVLFPRDRAEIICSAIEYFNYDVPQEIFDKDRK